MGEPSRCVGIVGLGLIGGSLARDLIARGADVMAYDRQVERLRALPDATLARVRLVDDLHDVAAARTVVIAVPVTAALSVLDALAPALTPTHLVMDVGGTKAAIVARAESLGIGDRFVGCHPLAGDHRSGWDASRTALFAGAPVFVCQPPSGGEDRVAAAEEFWRALGAAPVRMGAAAHDQRLGLTSHLPHMVASALVLALQSAGVARAELGPGGRDMTRLAASPPELWTDIALQNADALASALDACEATLRSLRHEIGVGDAARIEQRLALAARWFDDG
ncbi:MAG: prephenate dehydrogenase [Gemmatimonadaceae bacterium]